MQHETAAMPFVALFENPPLHSRGLDIVHNFRHRRSYRDIWHHLPADATRTVHNLQDKQFPAIWYGPHAELDPEQGIRGDLFCILDAIPRITSNDDLDEFVRSGIGGVAGNVAWSPAYPYDAQDWDDFREVLGYCRQHGLELWFYDEAGYPSGHANSLPDNFPPRPSSTARTHNWTRGVIHGLRRRCRPKRCLMFSLAWRASTSPCSRKIVRCGLPTARRMLQMTTGRISISSSIPPAARITGTARCPAVLPRTGARCRPVGLSLPTPSPFPRTVCPRTMG